MWTFSSVQTLVTLVSLLPHSCFTLASHSCFTRASLVTLAASCCLILRPCLPPAAARHSSSCAVQRCRLCLRLANSELIACVARDANTGQQLAGGHSCWCPKLESWTTHRRLTWRARALLRSYRPRCPARPTRKMHQPAPPSCPNANSAPSNPGPSPYHATHGEPRQRSAGWCVSQLEGRGGLRTANSGVERYRSPVSGSMHRTTEPSGAMSATLIAAAMVAPPEMPVKRPCGAQPASPAQPAHRALCRLWGTATCGKHTSSRARAREVWMASGPVTGTISSMMPSWTASSVIFGMKSGYIEGNL